MMKNLTTSKSEKRSNSLLSDPVKVPQEDDPVSVDGYSPGEKSPLDLQGIKSVVERQDILEAVADSRSCSD